MCCVLTQVTLATPPLNSLLYNPVPLVGCHTIAAGNSFLLSQKVLPVFLITPPKPTADVCYVSILAVYMSLLSQKLILELLF